MNSLPSQTPPLPKRNSNRSLWLRVRDRLVRFRLPLLLVGHLLVFSAIYWVTFLMRFTLDVPAKYVELFWCGLPVVVTIKLAVFYGLGSFHGWWRHVNFSDFVSLVKSAFVATLVVVVADQLVFQNWLPRIPRMILVNDFALTVVAIGGLRSVWRLWEERIAPLENNRSKDRALLVGNHYDAAKLAHLINAQRGMGVRIVGLVSTHKAGLRRYSDLRVVGHFDQVAELMRLYRAKSLFVMSGAIRGRELRALLDSASEHDFRVKVLPPLADQLQGTEKIPVRDVSYDDLLRRQPAHLDLEKIGSIVEGNSVLVTGAGGSIGSELCRQLLRFAPGKLILLGRGENRIYHLGRELAGDSLQTELIQVIANITDKDRIDQVFDRHKPVLVFHAAAHKHVPLVEQNVGEGVINNILGTKVIADAAHRHGTSKFVMVSTDKAVNPTSIMGCTKQMAERYCQALNSESDTEFISTRFGNVLGSAGSVVPLFQEQIRNGGPITITDRRMTRYFMTIPEASQLVIQAASMGNGGEIFVLEMGEPVKILDLAKDLIRLAALQPDSIEIVENGIRPGEKLYEELYYGEESSIPTSHSQILSARSRAFEYQEVEDQIATLLKSAYCEKTVLAELKRFVPDYRDDSAAPDAQEEHLAEESN